MSNPGIDGHPSGGAADQYAVGADVHRRPERPDDGDGRPDPGPRRTLPKGLPLLSRIPILGGLFGAQTLKNNRTELVLFITPRVVENEADIRSIVDDLRRKMDQLDGVFPIRKTSGETETPAIPSIKYAPGTLLEPKPSGMQPEPGTVVK